MFLSSFIDAYNVKRDSFHSIDIFLISNLNNRLISVFAHHDGTVDRRQGAGAISGVAIGVWLKKRAAQ